MFPASAIHQSIVTGKPWAPWPAMDRLQRVHCTHFSLQGEIFNRNHRSPPASPTPMMSLPENKCKEMVYFAISNHAFNMASRVYHQAGYLNFTITDDMVRMRALLCSPGTVWLILPSVLLVLTPEKSWVIAKQISRLAKYISIISLYFLGHQETQGQCSFSLITIKDLFMCLCLTF